MAIQKKVRFEVFKRDGFTCSYCGAKPPAVVLEIDHIEPKAKGGEDSIENLITSCFNCNRGKGSTQLSKIPLRLEEEMEIKQEKEDQIKAYRKLISSIRRRTKSDIKKIEKIYSDRFPGWEFSENFSQTTVKRFLSILPLHEIEEAMRIACHRLNLNENKVLNYFCGICWRKFDEGGRK